jgi:hypothetical protein
VTNGPKQGLPVALVAPGSLLGRDVRAVLKERAFPLSALHLFHTLGTSDGILTEDDDEAAFMAPLTPDALETSRLAFFCGAPADSQRFLERRGDDDCLIIDVSGLRRGGPFAAPGTTPLPEGNIFLTYDAVASVLAEAVAAVGRLARVTEVTAAVDRPASELGKRALDELFQQAISLAAFRPLPKEVFETQSAFNVFTPADTDDFDARVTADFTSLVGRPLPITLLSARAGIFHGHLLRMELRIEGAAPPVEELRRVFRSSASGFEETDPENLSGPVESAGRDETLVLRVASSDRSVRLHLASDHLRRGGAVMAVRLAEQAVRERGLLRDV